MNKNNSNHIYSFDKIILWTVTSTVLQQTIFTSGKPVLKMAIIIAENTPKQNQFISQNSPVWKPILNSRIINKHEWNICCFWMQETENVKIPSSFKSMFYIWRKQDKLFVTRKLSQREKLLKENQNQKHIKIIKQKSDVERDPNRLLQSTASWRERCKQNSKTELSTTATAHLHLRNMPHL